MSIFGVVYLLLGIRNNYYQEDLAKESLEVLESVEPYSYRRFVSPVSQLLPQLV